MMSKSFFLDSLGCAKNQVDSEMLIGFLEAQGYCHTDDPAQAGFIIVNSCGFIEPAKRESIETVLELKKRFPEKKVFLAGCLSLRYGGELARVLPEIAVIQVKITDPVFPRVFMERLAAKFSPGKAPRENTRHLLSFPGSAYVRIADGCSNNCSYCAIPLIRGPLASRTRDDIVAETAEFVGGGIREIDLIAQDTCSFGRDRGRPELVTLLRELDGLPGDFWIRLLYLHPDHLSDGIIDTVLGSKRILPYFDIPFQHGSARILCAMNRRGTRESYTELVRRIRALSNQAAIRTTFLVGFPGETDGDFAELVRLQEEIRPSWSGVFAYSREEGTAAFPLKPTVPKKIAGKRKKILEEKQTALTGDWLDEFIGSETDVLIEEAVAGENLVLGRAPFQAPEVDGLVVVENAQASPGSVIRVRLEKRSGIDLKGVRIHD